MDRFCSYGGGIDQHAVIGHPPESRDWKPGDETFEPVIDSTVRIEAFATVDSGLRAPTYIGERTWLMKHSHVGHDAYIGADCELSPGTVIGGHVHVGTGVRFGVNACVRPFIRIGTGARIGCGAVVVKDVEPGVVVVGNPARPLGVLTPAENKPTVPVHVFQIEDANGHKRREIVEGSYTDTPKPHLNSGESVVSKTWRSDMRYIDHPSNSQPGNLSRGEKT
jgi:UDP-N-acetylglucosamine acyltransferase